VGEHDPGPWVRRCCGRGSGPTRGRLLEPGTRHRRQQPLRFRGVRAGSPGKRASARRVVGARLFAGAYLARPIRLRQRRISIAGADPYDTFTNPCCEPGRVAAAPRLSLQATRRCEPPRLRPDLAGRWAVAVKPGSHAVGPATRSGYLAGLEARGVRAMPGSWTRRRCRHAPPGSGTPRCTTRGGG